MDNINYDNFYKFLVSMGMILIILPFSGLLFLCSDSFDLMISEQELLTYTETAQTVIAVKQSIPLLIRYKWVWIVAAIIMLVGMLMTSVGLFKWHGQQKLDDLFKSYEAKIKKAEAEKCAVTMSDEQIIHNMVEENTIGNSTSEYNIKVNKMIKAMLIEQRFFYYTKTNKTDYIVKRNVELGNCEFDVVAFSNSFFKKDYIYEVKYICDNISISQIDQYREIMKKQRQTFSEQTNHVPYAVLALVVADKFYEGLISRVKQLEKWNNYSVEIIKESNLSDY